VRNTSSRQLFITRTTFVTIVEVSKIWIEATDQEPKSESNRSLLMKDS
jgi:hypothetical protein